MRISELVEQLEDARAKVGDVEVQVNILSIDEWEPGPVEIALVTTSGSGPVAIVASSVEAEE